MPGQTEMTDSARAVRRCKACSHPVKGHPGPYGLARCRNREVFFDTNLTEEIVELVTAFDAVDVNQEATAASDNLESTSRKKEVMNPEIVTSVNEVNEEATVTLDDLNLSKGRKQTSSEIVISTDENFQEEAIEASDDIKTSAIKEITNIEKMRLVEDNHVPTKDFSGDESDSNDSNFLSDEEEFAQKIDDIVARLEESLIETGEEVSDHHHGHAPLDIRSVLSGGQFCICQCPPDSDVSSCQCEGELQLDCNLAGVVKNVYFDPSQDFQVDWRPSLKCDMKGWSKEKPNMLVLSMVGLERKGVKVVEGKISLEAFLLKGDEGLSGVVRGTMGLVVEVGKEFEKKGFKSPVCYKPVQFQLVRLEEEEIEVQ